MSDDALAQIKAREAQVRYSLESGEAVVRLPEQFTMQQIGAQAALVVNGRIYAEEIMRPVGHGGASYRVLRLIYDPRWFQTTDSAPLVQGEEPVTMEKADEVMRLMSGTTDAMRGVR